MKKVFIIIILVLVAILIAVGVLALIEYAPGFQKSKMSRSQKTEEEEVTTAVEEEVTTAVIVAEAVRGPIANLFQTNGEIVSFSSVDTYADVKGILARLYVELGDYVRINQVIAEVDPSQPGLTYALSPVKARVSGTITSLPLNQGDAVTPQISIATIGDLSRLQVLTAIPERYISRVQIGLSSDIYLQAWPGYVIPAAVGEISPVVDPASRTMRIKLDIPRNEPRAQAGMYAEVILTIEEKEDVVKIPTDAVLRRFGETFVFVVEDDVAEKRSVVLGISHSGIVEVVEGVEAGEKIVIKGQNALEDATKVRVLQKTQAVS